MIYSTILAQGLFLGRGELCVALGGVLCLYWSLVGDGWGMGVGVYYGCRAFGVVRGWHLVATPPSLLLYNSNQTPLKSSLRLCIKFPCTLLPLYGEDETFRYYRGRIAAANKRLIKPIITPKVTQNVLE